MLIGNLDATMLESTHLFILFVSLFQIIWLFSQVLIGNLDAAVFRYILLMGDFISLVDWQEVEDFKAFAAVVYPFLNVSLLYVL